MSNTVTDECPRQHLPHQARTGKNAQKNAHTAASSSARTRAQRVYQCSRGFVRAINTPKTAHPKYRMSGCVKPDRYNLSPSQVQVHSTSIIEELDTHALRRAVKVIRTQLQRNVTSIVLRIALPRLKTEDIAPLLA